MLSPGQQELLKKENQKSKQLRYVGYLVLLFGIVSSFFMGAIKDDYTRINEVVGGRTIILVAAFVILFIGYKIGQKANDFPGLKAHSLPNV